MKSIKLQDDGHIINVLTCAGRIPIPFQGIYGASKAALTLLTDTLRVELAPLRIAVTGVYPGTVNTSFEKNALREGDSYTLCPFESVCGSPPEVIARGVVQAARRRPRDAVEPPPKPDRPWEDLLIPR